jgi:thioredoxin reductase (NADPH)
VEGATEDIPIDNVLMAIGQGANCEGVDSDLLTQRGTIACDELTFRTSVDNVFAAGDVADPHYRQAIVAAAGGCRAAIDVKQYLS